MQPMGFNIMFSIVPILVILVFVFVFGAIIVSAVRGATTWKRNNDSPVLSVIATIVAKRTNVTHHNSHDGVNNTHHHSSTSTTYYITFEVESKDRMEFAVRGEEYGLLIEGDHGRLTFQGTRYLGFERI